MRALLPLLAAWAPLAAAAPFDLTHSGRLLDAAGGAMDGPHALTLTLYQGGSPVWTHAYSAVPVEHGFYSLVLFGVDSEWFTAPVELGIAVDGGAELSPRQALGSVPHALAADVATRLAVSSGASGSCAAEGAVVWDRATRSLRVCDENLSWTEVAPSAPTVGGRFEHVATMSGTGAVTAGDWAEAVARVTQQAADCRVRVDGRLAEAEYIEWTGQSLRFDFQPLNAWHNSWDAYAFVEMSPGTRAGLGSTYRKGNTDAVHKTSNEQHAIAEFRAFEVSLYCEPTSRYQHVASFNSAGQATSGSWSAFWSAIVDRNAMCKVRWDSRLHDVHHVEHNTNSVYLDFLGLVAHHDSHDAYAYIHVQNGTRAGLGSSYRRGHGANSRSYIRGFDREQYAENTFTGKAVDVLCADVFSDAWTISPAGAMTQGTWSSLYTAVVDEARDCRVAYDRRVSTPRYIEYGNGSLQFDFTNLAAFHDGHDAFAAVRLQSGSFAALDSSYRRGSAGTVILKTAAQHAWQGRTDTAVTVRCAPADYERVLTLSSGGIPMFGDWVDFYQQMQDPAGAPECRLRWDGRVTEPVLVETLGDGFYFDYQPLAAYHNNWDSYASFTLRAYQATGVHGTYRRGHDDNVWMRDRDQHAAGTLVPYGVDVMCR